MNAPIGSVAIGAGSQLPLGPAVGKGMMHTGVAHACTETFVIVSTKLLLHSLTMGPFALAQSAFVEHFFPVVPSKGVWVLPSPAST
jgi:hypothetical protein